jgi:hypothetical protein
VRPGNAENMPERACYEVENENPGEKRRLSCPVCSPVAGVGASLASSVPAFTSPLSALVCRGSGAVMDHENPPMALPNGQV